VPLPFRGQNQQGPGSRKINVRSANRHHPKVKTVTKFDSWRTEAPPPDCERYNGGRPEFVGHGKGTRMQQSIIDKPAPYQRGSLLPWPERLPDSVGAGRPLRK
jgi:hypothetical protein